MMVCSLLNYQIDEFIEFSVTQEHSESIEHLTSVVPRLCTSRTPEDAFPSIGIKNPMKSLDEYHNGQRISNGDLSPPDSEADETRRELEDRLAQFINHFLRQLSVVQSTPSMRTWLAQQMQNCVPAHLTHPPAGLQRVRWAFLPGA